MTIKCTDLDHLLMEGDPLAMAAAAKHAETCAACAATLSAWNDISATAQGMRAGWQSDMLWPRIERAMKRERRRGWTQLWQVAAALTIFLGIAAFAWQAIRVRQFDNAILRASALDQVEQAERQHVAAIDRLETLAEPALETPETPLMVSYKEKLMLLDDAIAECQKGIERNHNNAHLRKQLLAMYSEKQRTLRDVLREETHASR